MCTTCGPMLDNKFFFLTMEAVLFSLLYFKPCVYIKLLPLVCLKMHIIKEYLIFIDSKAKFHLSTIPALPSCATKIIQTKDGQTSEIGFFRACDALLYRSNLVYSIVPRILNFSNKYKCIHPYSSSLSL